MQLLVFIAEGKPQLGIKTAQGILDVATARTATGVDTPTTPEQFYQRGNDALASLTTLVERATDTALYLNESTLTLAPVVPNAGKILCVGLNYRKHAEETGAKIPEYPILFSKFNNSLAAHNEAIPLTSNMTQADYEAELLVVMGKTAKNVSEAEALDYVLGYAVANDLSERAFQMRSGQWLIGKTLDKFLPIGPYLVTADEAGDPQNMSVKGWLNGELRQNSNTSDMIFTVAQSIAYASQFMTLSPGDIISTGTPEGVILGMANKVWLKAGDEYTVEIGNLGRLTNKMIEG